MNLTLIALLLHSLGVSAEITTVYVHYKRAVTFAQTCTTFNTLLNLVPALATTSCIYPSVSGPYVTQVCLGLGALAVCSPAVTATSCAPAPSTLTTLTNFLGIPTATQLSVASTCSNAVYPPAAATAVAGSTCYADNVGGVRALTGTSMTLSSQTNAACRTYCTNLGFAYSGTEYGVECFCGNTLPSTISTTCTMVCSGAAAGTLDACGGINALSVLTDSALVTQNNQQAVLLASWTNQGCYSDNYPTRVLSAASTTSRAMSLETCVSFCNTGGYALAGVEYGSECYCGNTILTDGSTYGVSGASGCTFTCSGKSTQVCGGANVLNLYSKTPAVVPNNPSAAFFIPQPPTANGYTYIGCYLDNVGSRTLSVDKSSINSVGACITACANAGFKYAGVEFRSECFCDNIVNGAGTTLDSKNCNYKCTGTPSEHCGGSKAIAIYQGVPATSVTVPFTSNGFVYLDTYRDNTNNRILPKKIKLSSVTVGNCITACSNAGFTYAGLEWARECWCGSSLPSGLTGGLTPHMACTGNSAQFCGGSKALQTYSGVSSPQYLTTPFSNGQCVAGSTNDVRTLSVTMPASDNMTPAICKSECTTYLYYGVEYGRECYCGNSFSSQTAFSQSCDMACSGDSGQNCGGSNSLKIYNS